MLRVTSGGVGERRVPLRREGRTAFLKELENDINDYQKGSEVAFKRILQKMISSIRSIIRRRVLNEQDREEIEQEVLIYISVSLKKKYDSEIETGANPKAFILRAVDFKINDFIESRSRIKRGKGITDLSIDDLRERFGFNVASGDSTSSLAELKEAKRITTDILSCPLLTEIEKMILKMHYINGLSHREISNSFSFSSATVGNRIKKAIKKYREWKHIN